MRLHKLYLILAAIVLNVSCSDTHTIYLGSWQRIISDLDLGIDGSEILTFSSDSILEITNNMTMSYCDSNFNYTTKFVTVIIGKWSVDDNKITAHLDTSSYTFDTIPGKTLLIPAKANMAREAINALSRMNRDILSNLKAFYRETYADGKVLNIDKAIVINDTILSGFCNESQIIWYKTKTDCKNL